MMRVASICREWLMTTKTDVPYEQFHRLIPGADLGARNQVTIDFKSVAMTKIVTKTQGKTAKKKSRFKEIS